MESEGTPFVEVTPSTGSFSFLLNKAPASIQHHELHQPQGSNEDIMFVHFQNKVVSTEGVGFGRCLAVFISVDADRSRSFFALFFHKRLSSVLLSLPNMPKLQQLTAEDKLVTLEKTKRLGAISPSNSFILFSVTYHSLPKFKLEYRKVLEIVRKDAFFSCFAFSSSPDSSKNKRLFLASIGGRIYRYSYSVFGSSTLEKVFDFGVSFFITSICVYCQSNPSNGNIIAVTSADGLLKFFDEEEASPLAEIACQNKCLRNLVWDVNVNLLYFFNEAEERDLCALIFYRERKNERLKRVLRFPSKIQTFEICQEGDFYAILSEDSTIRIGALFDLRSSILSAKKSSLKSGKILSVAEVEGQVQIVSRKDTNFYGTDKEEAQAVARDKKEPSLALNRTQATVTVMKALFWEKEPAPNILACGFQNGLFLLKFFEPLNQ